jgi:hypothetical protein
VVGDDNALVFVVHPVNSKVDPTKNGIRVASRSDKRHIYKEYDNISD